jgi:hypothetical protein
MSPNRSTSALSTDLVIATFARFAEISRWFVHFGASHIVGRFAELRL